MNYIAPIETKWNGYRFRSRTEARWAVFFDHMNVQFQYELEGFELDDGVRYLPDFFLPQWNVWFEVKGPDPNELEIKKAGLLAALRDQSVLMAVGAPDYDAQQIIWFHPSVARIWREDLNFVKSPFYGDSWGNKPIKFMFRRTVSGRLMLWNEYFGFGYSSPGDDLITIDEGAIESAYSVARGARFEHGEAP
jgi:hypothetical protein